MNIDAALDCLFNIADIKAECVAISSPVQMCVIPLQKYSFICLERSGHNVKCWYILTLFLAFSLDEGDSRFLGAMSNRTHIKTYICSKDWKNAYENAVVNNSCSLGHVLCHKSEIICWNPFILLCTTNF